MLEIVLRDTGKFGYARRSRAKASVAPNGSPCAKGSPICSAIRGVSLQANGRYLDALALVDNPTNAKRELDRVTTPEKDAAGRRYSGFNPLAHHDSELVQALMAGERCLRGFSNHDIRARLAATVHLRVCGQDPEEKAPRSAGPFAGSMLTARSPRSRGPVAGG